MSNPSSPSWLVGDILRLSSVVTPEIAVTRATQLGVSPHLPSDKEISLLRDYRPTFGVLARHRRGMTLRTRASSPTRRRVLRWIQRRTTVLYHVRYASMVLGLQPVEFRTGWPHLSTRRGSMPPAIHHVFGDART